MSSGDLGLEEDEEEDETEESKEENKDIFAAMKEALGDKVKEVRASRRLKNTPVCLSSDGELTIEMEKVLSAMPNSQDAKADKVLEINVEHPVFEALKLAVEKNSDEIGLYTDLLNNQALLMEGLPIENPDEFSKNICKLKK